MKTKLELKALAEKLRDEAIEAGCYGAIIALSSEYPEGHSSFSIQSSGRCLEIEGLAARVTDWAGHIWDGKLDREAHKTGAGAAYSGDDETVVTSTGGRGGAG